MINITTDFEAGSISVISAEQANDIQLAINTDNQSCTRQWFYFSVATTHPTEQTIRMMNAAQVSFSQAWDGYQAFASYDNQDWFRVDTAYIDGELRIRHQSNSTKVYYAYFAPYPAKREQALLQELATNDASTISILGQTPQGRDLPLIRIGSTSDDARKIWIIARQHPGETMAQWVAEGVIKYLSDYFKRFVENAQNITFYIVANMNPDGSAIGNHRTNANGINLNRHWASPDPVLCPEVHLVKNAMLEIGVDLFIDLHGDETLPYNFMMSEDNPPFAEHLKQALATENDNFQTRYDYSTEVTACGGATCGSSCGQQKATTFVQKNFGVPAVLLESPFKLLQLGKELKDWDHKSAIKLGNSLAKILVREIAPC